MNDIDSNVYSILYDYLFLDDTIEFRQLSQTSFELTRTISDCSIKEIVRCSQSFGQWLVELLTYQDDECPERSVTINPTIGTVILIEAANKTFNISNRTLAILDNYVLYISVPSSVVGNTLRLNRSPMIVVHDRKRNPLRQYSITSLLNDKVKCHDNIDNTVINWCNQCVHGVANNYIVRNIDVADLTANWLVVHQFEDDHNELE